MPTTFDLDKPIARSEALRLGLGLCAGVVVGGVFWAAGSLLDTPTAQADTASALASAQAQYWAVQAQIDELAAAAEAVNTELSWTLEAIEVKQGEIEYTRRCILEREVELVAAQDQLATYIADNYKAGTVSLIDILLASTSLEDLASKMYYVDKVKETQAALIDSVKDARALLTVQQAELEGQMGELQTLQAQQQSQLAELHEAQNQTLVLLSGLGDEVAALTAQYNAELYAAAQAAAAARASGDSDSYYDEPSYNSGYSEPVWVASASDVVNACYYTPSPGAGWCAAWVTNVMINAGVGYFGGDACDMYWNWCWNSSFNSLQPGMIVAVPSHPHTTAGQIYGHIGIYIGGGLLMDNIGYIRTISIYDWCDYYGATYTPRWGWIGGIALA